ncbi:MULTISPECIES: Asp23/Gls24 family envelope stress response protein [Cryobacterium]|uniref:Asp23/Gls24 family envelope stress response protein n=1 Tax=Cryobacterium glucosi TaxID=1259175 RepID=A0ABY2IK33_9MICO|nr:MULTISPECIES: Asp23/Gls24 family envelope stress response protein [Cryobacterium]TFC07112.1 Asp23/Gls24 family envelope stress response protein [Cryobacterium sp. MDB2-33-2]TFC12493.1 Asp23/Gls24 family envelope stress response protein [Cryobacterium sp. MDB2-10]TFC18677.1 Asp23/Gls24 family envelope stress response protein [Cryobacterium glucosi]
MAFSSPSAVTLPSENPGGSAGKTFISESIIAQVAGIAARDVTGVYALGGGMARALGALRETINGTDASQGIDVDVEKANVVVNVTLVAQYPARLQQTAADVREAVVRAVEDLIGMTVTEVNVTIADIHEPDDTADPLAGSVSNSPAHPAPVPPSSTPMNTESENTMSASDKINNAAEDLKGKANEAIGKAANDDSKVAEGRAEQASASVKKAGENVKDAFTS